MEAKITFANGMEIKAEVNGNNYIVDKEPSFPTNLKNIKIETEEGANLITNGQIVKCYPLDKRYWFTICEVPQGVIKDQQVNQRISDIEDALCEITKE